MSKGSNNKAISLPIAKLCLENSFSKEKKIFWNRKNVPIPEMKEYFTKPRPIPVTVNVLQLWIMCESVVGFNLGNVNIYRQKLIECCSRLFQNATGKQAPERGRYTKPCIYNNPGSLSFM